MKKVNRNIWIVLSFLLIGIGGVVWIALMPANLSTQLHENYIFLVIAYFLYTYFLWITFVWHRIDLFEPFVFVSAMYFALLIFAPMVCIIRGTTLILGADTMGGCIKGTIVFLVSFFFFSIGYYKKSPRNEKHKKVDGNGIFDKCQLMLLFWVGCLF